MITVTCGNANAIMVFTPSDLQWSLVGTYLISVGTREHFEAPRLTCGDLFREHSWAPLFGGCGSYREHSWALVGTALTCSDDSWALMNMILPKIPEHKHPQGAVGPGLCEGMGTDGKRDHNEEGNRS